MSHSSQLSVGRGRKRPDCRKTAVVAVSVVILATLHVGVSAGPSVSGRVRRHNDKSAVSDTTVGILGASKTRTSDSGQFTIILAENFRPGDNITLFVDGWRLVKPWEGEDKVPNSTTEVLELLVARPGDRVLISSNHIPLILTPYYSQIKEGSLEVYLKGQANQLGFSAGELKSSIHSWSQIPQGNYEKGIAALYQGRMEEARIHLMKSITEVPSTDPAILFDRYLVLAHSENKLWRFDAASENLQFAKKIDPTDPAVDTNIALVESQRRGDPFESIRLLREANRGFAAIITFAAKNWVALLAMAGLLGGAALLKHLFYNR